MNQDLTMLGARVRAEQEARPAPPVDEVRARGVRWRWRQRAVIGGLTVALAGTLLAAGVAAGARAERPVHQDVGVTPGSTPPTAPRPSVPPAAPLAVATFDPALVEGYVRRAWPPGAPVVQDGLAGVEARGSCLVAPVGVEADPAFVFAWAPGFTARRLPGGAVEVRRPDGRVVTRPDGMFSFRYAMTRSGDGDQVGLVGLDPSCPHRQIVLVYDADAVD